MWSEMSRSCRSHRCEHYQAAKAHINLTYRINIFTAEFQDGKNILHAEKHHHFIQFRVEGH